MESRHIRAHCGLDHACQQLLKSAVERLELSARAYDRILKVSRTVADLDGKENIGSSTSRRDSIQKFGQKIVDGG